MGVQLRAVRAALANRELRLLLLAWLVSSLAVWGGLLAFSVYAYDRGGAAAVGLIAMVRALPGAPAAPLLALVVDRVPRRRAMIVTNGSRATVMLAIAGAVAADVTVAVYALVALLAAVGPAFRPAFAAVLPLASRTPGELASANVVASLATNVGFLAGTLAVGLLLSVMSVELVIALLGFVFLASVLPLMRLAGDARPAREPNTGMYAETSAGLRAIRSDAGLREVAFITLVLWFVDGALDVLVVVAALGFLAAGEAGAGALTATWAAGCLVGGFAVIALLGRGHLTRGIAIGGTTFGIAATLMGLVPALGVALLAIGVFGLGFTLVEVALATLTQRLTPGHLLGRVGGILEAATVTAAACGSLTAGLLAAAIGAQTVLVAVGVLAPVIILLRYRRLRSFELGTPAAERQYQLLRAHEIFAPLSVATTERLANELHEVRPECGQVVVREGDCGDHFFLVAEGEMVVEAGGRRVRTCGPGDGFGEIALIRDVPRTATVTATEGVLLFALNRHSFLSAVGVRTPSWRAAHRISDQRSP